MSLGKLLRLSKPSWHDLVKQCHAMPSIVMGYKPCAVSGCEDRYSPRHRFPNPEKYEELFNKWVNLCCNIKLQDFPAKKIYSSYRVCHIHFTPQDISSNNFLRKGISFPTVSLPANTNSIPQLTILCTPELQKNETTSEECASDKNTGVPQTSSIPELQKALHSTKCTIDKNTDISIPVKEQCFKSKDTNECKLEIISSDENQLQEDAEIENEIDQKDIRIIDRKDFSKVCRTCMNSAPIMVPILESVLQNEIKLVDLLLECASIHVNSSDCLPLYVCSNCLGEILRIHSFRKQCSDVDQSLKALLLNAPSLIDHNYSLNFFDYEQIGLNSNKKLPQEEIIEQEELVIESKPTELEKLPLLKPNQKREYKCGDCEASFSVRTVLLAHLKETKHSEFSYYECELCKKRFTKNKTKLREHMRSHTQEKPFQCKLCELSFSLNCNLRRHMKIHTGERPHVCQRCGKSFIQRWSLKCHIKTHTDADVLKKSIEFGRFNCKRCGRIFKRPTPYLNHLKMHKINDYKKNNNQEAIITEIKEATEAQTKLYLCEICSKRYKTKQLLKLHLLTHGEKTFLCSDCGKSFYSQPALNSHLTVHTGDKSFTCTTCSKSFRQSSCLTQHMLIHSGLKPHQCHLCPKAFTQSAHLKYHLVKHNRSQSYACNYCYKRFGYKSSLTVHLRTHTGEIVCSCTVCGKGFYCRSSLNKHKKSHKGENNSSSNQQKCINLQ